MFDNTLSLLTQCLITSLCHLALLKHFCCYCLGYVLQRFYFLLLLMMIHSILPWIAIFQYLNASCPVLKSWPPEERWLQPSWVSSTTCNANHQMASCNPGALPSTNFSRKMVTLLCLWVHQDLLCYGELKTPNSMFFLIVRNSLVVPYSFQYPLMPL